MADLRTWAEAKLNELMNVVIGNGGTMHEMRQVVHALVDRIEIDPHAKKGVMYLPANAQALLEAAATSRVRVPSSKLPRLTRVQFRWRDRMIVAS